MARKFKGNPLMDGSVNLAEITQSVAFSEEVQENSVGKANEGNTGAGKTKQDKPRKVRKSKENVPSSEKGCKLGYTRHTYLLSKDMVDRIRLIADFFGWTETATLEQLLRKGIDEAVAKYGDELNDSSKKRKLF